MKTKGNPRDLNAELEQLLADIRAGASPLWTRKTVFTAGKDGSVTRTVTNENEQPIKRKASH